MFKYFLSFLLIFLSSCTSTITLVHTEGQATDVVDESTTNTPSTNIVPPVPIPL